MSNLMPDLANNAPFILRTLLLYELQVTVFALIVWGIDRWLRQAYSGFRYALWLVVLVKALWPPSFAIPRLDILPAVPIALPVLAVTATSSSVPHVSQSSLPPAAIPLLLWGLLSAGLLVLMLISFVTFRLRLRAPHAYPWQPGVDSPLKGRRWPPIWFTDRIPSPLTLGLIRPRIFLTPEAAAADPATLDAILHHELAHVRRRDGWITLLQAAALVIHPFNPLVWLMNRRLTSYREQVCDEFALRHTGIAPYKYGQALIDQLRRSVPSPLMLHPKTLFFETKRDLKQRLQQLLIRKEGTMKTHTTTKQKLLLAGLMAGLLTVASQCSLKRESPTPDIAEPAFTTEITTFEVPTDGVFGFVVGNFATAGNYRVVIYDVQGNEIVVPFNSYQDAGTSSRIWDGIDADGNPVPPGTYFIRTTGPGGSETNRIIIPDLVDSQATTTLPRPNQIERPYPSLDEININPNNVTNVLVNNAGQVLHDDELISLDGLDSRISSLLAENPLIVVSLKTEPDTPDEIITAVEQEIRQAGATRVQISEAEAPPPPAAERPSVPFVPYDESPAPTGGYQGIMQKVVYPYLAREAGIEGTVVVYAFIDESGQVVETMVLESIPGLDEAAVEAVKNTTWRPAKQRDRTVGVWVSIPIVFNLQEEAVDESSLETLPGSVELTQSEPEPIGGYAAIQQHLEYPEQARAVGAEGTVIVRVSVTETGRIEEIRAGYNESGNPDLAEAAMAAIRNTAFKPALQDGNPVSAWTAIPVSFHLAGVTAYDQPPQPVGGDMGLLQHVAYPEQAQAAGIEGTVTVQVFIDENGQVGETTILEGIPMLNDAAIAAIRNTTFEPARQEGTPVGVSIKIPIIFRLPDEAVDEESSVATPPQIEYANNESEPSGTTPPQSASTEDYTEDITIEETGQESFEWVEPPPPTPTYPTPGTDIPFIVYDTGPVPVGGYDGIQRRVEYPQIAREAGIQGQVVVYAFIDTDGIVKETMVLRSIPMLDQAAVDAVIGTRFSPAKQRDQIVAVWLSIPIVFYIDG